MTFVLAENWWSLVIRGLAALILGVVAFVWPGITLAALVVLFGAYALIDGVVCFMGAWKASRSHERWGALVLEGIAGIAASIITILWPAITAFALVVVIAARHVPETKAPGPTPRLDMNAGGYRSPRAGSR